MNIFECASRERIRFNFIGTITVEDLWDLNQDQLDNLYRQISAKLKTQSDDGLIKKTKISAYTSTLHLQLDLVSHVFKENNKMIKENENKVLRQKKKKQIMEIIANKKDQELLEKSVEDLMSMLDEL